MKIGDLNAGGLNGLSTGSVGSSQGLGAYARGGRGGYGSGPDQVQLSGASRVACSAIAAHTARLAQLKSLVASGGYNPPTETISKAILVEALSRGS